LGEPDDCPDLAHLPPKERAKMRRLRGWLAARVWSPSQAIAVLCGYDPEVGPNTCSADMAFLPGVHDFYGVPVGARAPDDLRALDAGIEDQRSYVSGLRLSTKPPGEAIKTAASAGVLVPWLEAALTDAECRKLLPEELLRESPAERPLQVANREKAQKRWAGDDKQALMKGGGREEFDRLRAAGFEGCTREDKSPVIIQVALAVLEAIQKIEPLPAFHPSRRTAERHVKKWLEEDQPDNAGALSDDAGAQMAK
jgi:hypothetical protein